eukprot:7420043-Prorocentrum_lima.AAC.1
MLVALVTPLVTANNHLLAMSSSCQHWRRKEVGLTMSLVRPGTEKGKVLHETKGIVRGPPVVCAKR